MDVWSDWAVKECKAHKGRFHIGASEKRCKQVHGYKYTSPRLSIAEELGLNEFWNQFAELYPPWLAPNLITFVGLVMQLSAFTLLFTYSPDLEGKAPWWVYLWAAFALFVYQTMDGTDGKQAKRTKSGSALGELFDHGCDALATTVYAQYILDIMGWGVGEPLWSTITVVSSYGAFMTSNAVLVYEGVLPIQRLDCQELQLTIIGFCLLSAAFGIGWRDAMIPTPFTSVPLLSSLPLPLPAEVSASKLIFGVGWLVSLQSQALFVSRALRSNKDRLFRSAPGTTLMAMALHMFLTATAWHFTAWKFATMSLMMVAFGDLMLRTIYIRIGDPEATSYSPGAWALLAASVVNPYPAVEVVLVAAMLAAYAYRVATVIAQLVGCLGIPGVFRIVRR